jgi:hypothetical protein
MESITLKIPPMSEMVVQQLEVRFPALRRDLKNGAAARIQLARDFMITRKSTGVCCRPSGLEPLSSHFSCPSSKFPADLPRTCRNRSLRKRRTTPMWACNRT